MKISIFQNATDNAYYFKLANIEELIRFIKGTKDSIIIYFSRE